MSSQMHYYVHIRTLLVLSDSQKWVSIKHDTRILKMSHGISAILINVISDILTLTLTITPTITLTLGFPTHGARVTEQQWANLPNQYSALC